MWSPKLEARALQEVKLRSGETVLEIGTGSGYLTALLASLAGHVTSVEIVPALARDAKAKLAAAGFDNVELHVGDGARGFGSETLRRDRAHRLDAGAARGVLQAAEARRPRVRDRRRRARDDRAPRTAGPRRARAS